MIAINYKHMLAFIALALIACGLFAVGAHAAVLILPAAAVELEELAKEFKSKTAEVSALKTQLEDGAKELRTKMEGGEKVSRELKETIDRMLTDFNAQKLALQEVEQKMSNPKFGEPEAEKSWGQQFIESEAFTSAKNRSTSRGTIAASVKAVTSTAAGGLIRSVRETEVTNLLRERRVMRDLLPAIQINSSSVDYAVQTTRTNNADVVAESATKPTSDFAWSSETVVVRVIAHLAKITRQAMDDAPRLMGEIDAEMRYGLGYVEERQFLYGTGVGQNLHGIVPQATAFAWSGDPIAFANRIDVLRLAALQVSLALLPADGIVLNELDWAIIELSKTEDGAYIFANPQGSVSPRMWSLPVVATPAMDADDFLVGSFRGGATVYDRMAVEVLISTENADDFEKNLATVRAEERVAIAVKRPGAFVTGAFSTAIPLIS